MAKQNNSSKVVFGSGKSIDGIIKRRSTGVADPRVNAAKRKSGGDKRIHVVYVEG